MIGKSRISALVVVAALAIAAFGVWVMFNGHAAGSGNAFSGLLSVILAILWRAQVKATADRRRVEEDLAVSQSQGRASEERWQLAMEGANEGLWDWIARTNEVFYSPRWKNILGYTDAELPNSPAEWEKRVHPDDVVRVQNLLDDHLKRKSEHYEAEYRMLAKDGTYRWVLSRGKALWDMEGNPVRMVGSHTDITDRKLAETALRAAKESAEEFSRTAAAASKAKDSFLAHMSHELRTPMNGVLGALDLVLLEELAPKHRDLLCTAKTSAEGLLGLVNDILDLSKIEAGKMELDRAPFAVRQVIADVMKMFSVPVESKGLGFTVVVDREIPDNVLGDALRFRQVLINLVGNALKFTESGGISVHCGVAASRTGSIRIRTQVADTGVGIPVDKQLAVFEAFRQVDASSTRRFSGTGLGLAISSRLVELMGGVIHLQSEAGKGSTFTFDVLLGISDAVAETPLKVDSSAVESNRRLRVLVAEDNLVNQKVMNGMLSKDGHHIRIAANGRDAVDALQQETFDLVFMDVQMPIMDGIQAVIKIREWESQAGSRTPIVALTAHAMKGDQDKCLEAGMDGYLTKPVSLDNLRRALAEYSRPEVAA